MIDQKPLYAHQVAWTRDEPDAAPRGVEQWDVRPLYFKKDGRRQLITNDIYTREDAEFLMRSQALPLDRIVGVETGGCPHTAIREDASANLAAIDQLRAQHPELELVLIESGGDNLAATFSPELADLTIYVIDVASGEDIPRKGGPGITRSDLLVVNKTDLAPHVGASLARMEADAARQRGARPVIFANLRAQDGVAEIADFVLREGGLPG